MMDNDSHPTFHRCVMKLVCLLANTCETVLTLFSSFKYTNPTIQEMQIWKKKFLKDHM